jgi:hypothetical protein
MSESNVLFSQPLHGRDLVFVKDPIVAFAKGEAGKERKLGVWNNDRAAEFYVDDLLIETSDWHVCNTASVGQPRTRAMIRRSARLTAT